jgi:hypothetical protein
MRCEERTGIEGSLADIDKSTAMLLRSISGRVSVYCRPLFSIDGSPASLRRLESGLRACRLNPVVYATHRRLRSTGIHLENLLSTFVVLFGTTALVATALLFVLQMFEDFRNA